MQCIDLAILTVIQIKGKSTLVNANEIEARVRRRTTSEMAVASRVADVKRLECVGIDAAQALTQSWSADF
jgi:hypothetical protein